MVRRSFLPCLCALVLLPHHGSIAFYSSSNSSSFKTLTPPSKPNPWIDNSQCLPENVTALSPKIMAIFARASPLQVSHRVSTCAAYSWLHCLRVQNRAPQLPVALRIRIPPPVSRYSRINLRHVHQVQAIIPSQLISF